MRIKKRAGMDILEILIHEGEIRAIMFKVFHGKQGHNQKIFEIGLTILKQYCDEKELNWNEWEHEAITSISDCIDYWLTGIMKGIRK